jgi:c-di-GMP-binding flagellar brake protein YcgR
LTNLDIKPMRKGPPSISDAVRPIAANAEAHDMRDAFDIGEALLTLAQSGDPVTVYPADEHPFLARIDAVDTEAQSFVLDIAGHALGAPCRAVFVASMGGNARIQFELEGTWDGLADTPNLVPLPFPAACRVQNRRAEQRLDTPVGGGYGARFTVHGKVFELPLYDFSGSGVGLRASPGQALDLNVGKKLEGVELELGRALAITADLEIRLLRPFRTFLLGPQVQVGCRISNISMQMRHSLDRAIATVRRRS